MEGRFIIEKSPKISSCVVYRIGIKRYFAGGPQIQKMTMPDNMSSQLLSIDKVKNQGLVYTQEKLVKI